MATFSEDVKAKVTSYLDGDSISNSLLAMLTDLAIETYVEIRNYPSTYTQEKIEEDMRKRINRIAYAVVEVNEKFGVEGQNSFSENGISRAYKDGFISTFNDIVPFAHFL